MSVHQLVFHFASRFMGGKKVVYVINKLWVQTYRCILRVFLHTVFLCSLFVNSVRILTQEITESTFTHKQRMFS